MINEKELIDRFSAQTGHVGFYCENLITGERFAYHADDRFASASVIKLPVFACIAKWAAEGKADLAEKIKVRSEAMVPGCGALSLFTGEPEADIRTLCNLMISVSDNCAANLLIDRFGMQAFSEEFKAIGLRDTSLVGRFFDRDAAAFGKRNEFVPSELAMLLKKVYERRFVDRQTSEDVENTLLLQQFNHKIPDRIADPTIPIAHKTGERTGVSHDVGLVYAMQPFVICFAGERTNVPEFNELIRQVSFEIFSEYNVSPLPPAYPDKMQVLQKSETEPREGETKYSPTYIYRQVFGTLMRGHHQKWPDIHLDELRLLNPDTIGWIHMEDSPINYPVVKARSVGDVSNYYLKHNFSGEENYHGTVSMDLRNGGTLGERTTVLGAHHLKDGSMFFAVSKLFSEEYYATHKTLELLLTDGLYRADFFAVHYINSSDPEPIRVDFSSDADYESWLAERKKQALYDIPLTPEAKDRVLVLRTCVYPEDPDDRRSEIAAYAVLSRIEDRSLLPKRIEKRGKAPELLRPVNLQNPLPWNYVPDTLPVRGGIGIDRRCRMRLLELVQDCRAVGGCPFILSAYRSAEYQKGLFEREVERRMAIPGVDRRLAEGAAAWFCAPPGTSEHQLGLAADLACAESETAAFTVLWLAQNAWRYGFILRYPEGKEDVTGIMHEPWHYRYVGREAAEEMQRFGLTLEEYLELYYD